MNYIEIQNDIIQKYGIDICDGTKCKCDWSRTHAHVKERRVCKWKQDNTIKSTFTLFHEIGHIQTTTPKMRRAESEYYATAWAIDELKKYDIETPRTILYCYQRYVLVEQSRGERRGGTGYGELNLYKFAGIDIDLDIIRNQARREGWLV